MALKIIEMARNGRLVVPTETRQLLGLRDESSQLEVEIVDGSIVLTPVVTVRIDRTFPITPVLVELAAHAATATGPGHTRDELVAALGLEKN